MSRTMATALLIFVCLCPLTTHADQRTTQLDSFMTGCYEYGLFNGAVLVAKADTVILKKGYGHANLEWQIPFEPDTRYSIASITKQFTTVTILQLVDEGRLRLEDRLIDIIQEYRQDTGERVTIDHLLQHTSGIPDFIWTDGFWSDSSRLHYEQDHFVRNFLSGDLQFEPGATYRYSNSGLYLLGIVIERVTGLSYEENIDTRILKPLGMNNSGIDTHEEIIPRRASGYVRSLEGYRCHSFFEMTNLFATGNMYSTVEDMLKWSRAFESDLVLSDSMRTLMLTPYFDVNPHFQRAYAWDVVDLRLRDSQRTVRGHHYTGGLNGFQSHLWRLPEGDYTIILFCNTGEPGLFAIVPEMLNILHGTPYKLPRIPISYVLRHTLQKEGLGAAEAEYFTLKEKHHERYNFSERELNSFGYQLLRTGRTEAATLFFRINVAANPESANAYDSYAEALLAGGNKDLAVESYNKSLELNPHNTNATRMLKLIADRNQGLSR